MQPVAEGEGIARPRSAGCLTAAPAVFVALDPYMHVAQSRRPVTARSTAYVQSALSISKCFTVLRLQFDIRPTPVFIGTTC